MYRIGAWLSLIGGGVAVASVVIIVAGILGFAATLPWYINTFYVAALPLWIVGAALLLFGGFSARRA